METCLLLVETMVEIRLLWLSQIHHTLMSIDVAGESGGRPSLGGVVCVGCYLVEWRIDLVLIF